MEILNKLIICWVAFGLFTFAIIKAPFIVFGLFLFAVMTWIFYLLIKDWKK
jgi:hypothetical protein